MNKKIVENLEDVFSVSAPATLRRSLNEVFYSYVINTEILPSNFREISSDIYFLNDFLEKADAEYRKSKTKKEVIKENNQ